MASDIFWIETASNLKLAIMARPRSGDWLEDEIANWAREGVGLVVCLLDREEVDELGLQSEPTVCRTNQIEFISYPIADRGVPTDAVSAVALAQRIISSGKPTAIHCRAGIGRSSVIAALTLRLAGISSEEAFSAIGEARRLAVPDTDAQREWVCSLPLG
jgi:protein-tyrosine phosphatase